MIFPLKAVFGPVRFCRHGRTLFCIAGLLLLTTHAQAWRFLGFGTPSASQRPRFAHRYDGQGAIKWIRLPHQRSHPFYL